MPVRISPQAKKQQAPVRTGGGPVRVSPPAREKHDDGEGGGWFGAIKRLPGDVGSDLYDAAVGAPAGVYYSGKAAGLDAASAIEDTVRAVTHTSKSVPRVTPEEKGRTKELLGLMARSTIEDFRHPLRHPGYTALDVLGLASLGAGTAARGAAAGKALRAGEGVAEAVDKFAHRPVAPPRTFRVGDLEVEHPSSRAALTRGVQRVADKRLHAKAEKNPSGRAAKRLSGKVSKVLEEEGRIDEALGKAPGAALHAIGKKLNDGEKYALRVVAEEAPLNKRIAATRESIQNSRGAERRRHAKRLALLEETRKHIVDPDGKPEFTPESTKLKAVYAKMSEVAGSREQLAKDLGLLTDEAIQGRKTQAGRAAMGAKFEVPLEQVPDEHIHVGMRVRPLDRENVGRIIQHDPQARTATVYFHNRQTNARASVEFPYEDLATEGKGRLVGNEDFEASPSSVYIPDVEQRVGRTGRISSVGGQGVIGSPRSPIREGYTGAMKRTAREPLDTPRAVAEASFAMSRFHRLSKLRGKLVKAASPEPRFKDDIAIRLDNLGQNERLPADVRAFLDDPSAFGPDEVEGVFEKVRKHALLAPENADEFERLHAEGKIGWVPKKMLGDLAKPHAPLRASTGKIPVAVADEINNASRIAILFLKPAYAAPNIMGNAALNLIQQGFAMPRHLAHAAAMQWRLGPENTAKIDTLMHEGFAAALRGEGSLPASTVATAGANIWGKGVDRPFRRASWDFEAGRSGFRSPEQIDRLLNDPALHNQLVDVTKRANRQIIDYGRLSHREREVIRRVIFFYPWVKGSTVYAGNMLMEYPAKSAAIGKLGQYGIEKSQEELGDTPSYLKGAFKGPGGGLSNPTSAAIFQTPAQAGAILAGLATGRVPEVAEPAEQLTPTVAALLNVLSGKNLRTGHEYPRTGRGLLDVAYDTLVTQLPEYRLAQQVKGTSSARLFKPSPRAGLMQYLFGGLYPRQYDPSRLHALAKREQKELGNR